ncbi:MAG TPA: hypothetical protein VIM11_10835 [Tepidisphaeraceae bacterium]|jgi:hypothetical protein
MRKEELGKRIERAACKVFGWRDAPTDGNRRVIGAVVEAFDNSESAVLVEPSLSRKTSRPPDVVLIDPEVGVAVFEVKGIGLDQIEGIEPGGVLVIRYRGNVQRRNAIAQVRTHMFDIKDATARVYDRELTIPFRYWVVFPSIHRAEWMARFGREGFCPPEFLFAEDVDRAALLKLLRATDRAHDLSAPIRTCRLEELQCVWTAFGDNSVLYVRPEQRPDRKVDEGTLGDFFDQRATALKTLSAEQKELSETYWEKGPRLVRGVAGSGKTIVLANNLARRAKHMLVEAAPGLFGAAKRRPRIAAVCFNRTLAPFLKIKIETAFEQRTGRALPDGVVHVQSLNTLMYRLSREGAWPYETSKGADPAKRAKRYRDILLALKSHNPEKFEQIAFDAIYVDEGQDFVEAEFELLRDLCRTAPGGEPSLFVFYDDAQNLYGRSRPNWTSVGLNLRGGRAFVMTECFRNPQAIVETSFNVLYGTAVDAGRTTPTRDFGDIAWLQQKGLIALEDGRWRVRFASRIGRPPILTLASDAEREIKLILARLTLLIRDDRVRPQDILIVTYRRDRARAIADAIKRERIAGIEDAQIAFEQKESALCQPGRVTVSTVHSAKGYDAFVVLLCSANEFSSDVKGRACFYVACTRAIEHLEVFAYERAGLALELERLLQGSPRPYGG